MLMGTARRSDELEQSLCETRSRKGTLLYVNELYVLCLSNLFFKIPTANIKLNVGTTPHSTTDMTSSKLVYFNQNLLTVPCSLSNI